MKKKKKKKRIIARKIIDVIILNPTHCKRETFIHIQNVHPKKTTPNPNNM